MKRKLLIGGLLAMLATGCAGNRDLLDSSIGEAEGMSRAAQAEGIKSQATVQADKDLALAKQLSEEGKTDEAFDAAERSRLEYRLAFAQKDAKDAAIADSSASKELKGDLESQKLYQSILDSENQGKESAK
ncbi:MAG: hypothetical protein J6Z31_09540 [Fibrobacter sp.]|nr:hypothetical protein [Fibrobacter sp.]